MEKLRGGLICPEINLLHGDCLELMKDIPDGSVDLVLTDPPYLIDYHTARRKDKTHDFCTSIQGDTNPGLITQYIEQCYRILKDNTAMYMFCSPDRVDFFKQALERVGFKIKNLIVWVKNNHTAGDLKAQFGKRYELLFLVNKGRKFFNGERLTDVWYFDKVAGSKQVHQNQKPIDLLTRCILKHSNKGDIVFDGFSGSGSTGVACVNTGRKFIGIEIEEKYFNIAKERINSALLSLDNPREEV